MRASSCSSSTSRRGFTASYLAVAGVRVERQMKSWTNGPSLDGDPGSADNALSKETCADCTFPGRYLAIRLRPASVLLRRGWTKFCHADDAILVPGGALTLPGSAGRLGGGVAFLYFCLSLVENSPLVYGIAHASSDIRHRDFFCCLRLHTRKRNRVKVKSVLSLTSGKLAVKVEFTLRLLSRKRKEIGRNLQPH